MSSATTTNFDLDGLVAALEADNPEAIAALYAPGVVVEAYNRDHGPAAPLVIRGRDGVLAAAADTASRDLTHKVERAVTDGSTGAIQLRCTYPDGPQVLCLSTFEYENGLIVRESRTDVWDA